MADADLTLERFATYLTQNRHMEAMVVAKKLVELRPREPELGTLLVRLYLAKAQHGRAAQELEDVLRVWPGLEPSLREELRRCAQELVEGERSGDVERLRFARRQFEAGLERALPLPSPDPTRLRTRASHPDRARILLSLIVIAGSLAALTSVWVERGGVREFVLANDLLCGRQPYPRGQFDLVGTVVPGSLATRPGTSEYVFALGTLGRDLPPCESAQPIRVLYVGTLPDLMKDGAEVFLTGGMEAGSFRASFLGTRCGKYTAVSPEGQP